MIDTKTLIERLHNQAFLSKVEWEILLTELFRSDANLEFLSQTAHQIQRSHYGNQVYLRALLEISNYCPNGCKYCGISQWNKPLARYRLNPETIEQTVTYGYGLGYRSFVIQGGEDPYYTDAILLTLIQSIKTKYPDIALALSIGERSESSYRALYQAGVDRYLLRHETANEARYTRLHPGMSFRQRVWALQTLKRIGFQTGSGFLVGLPETTPASYAEDFLFLEQLQPEMIGIGPFIPHHCTPMANDPAGKVREVKILISLLRIAFPKALIPSTTALGTLDPMSRYEALTIGANVMMPNITPMENRKRYTLYDGKRISQDESAVELQSIQKNCEKFGMKVALSRGDHYQFVTHENRTRNDHTTH